MLYIAIMTGDMVYFNIGVFKSTETYDVYIDIKNVVELTQVSVS